MSSWVGVMVWVSVVGKVELLFPKMNRISFVP